MTWRGVAATKNLRTADFADVADKTELALPSSAPSAQLAVKKSSQAAKK
jgi:hypothetical protein